jgi:hypothetical protein
MHVECTRHVDASEPDAAGMHEYHYEYDIYTFTQDDLRLVARSYTDEPAEAHFLRIETRGKPRLLRDADLDHPLFIAAQAHLVGLGKSRLRWLSGRGDGYDGVPHAPSAGGTPRS